MLSVKKAVRSSVFQLMDSENKQCDPLELKNSLDEKLVIATISLKLVSAGGEVNQLVG